MRSCRAAMRSLASIPSRPVPPGAARLTRKTPVHERAEQLGIEVRDAANASRCRGAGAIPTSRPRYRGRRGLRPDLAQADPRCAEAGLHQRPRLAPAPLARRGADPAGDPRRRRDTGVTLMQMDEGLDTGPMLLKRELYHRDKNAGQLTEELANSARICWATGLPIRLLRSPSRRMGPLREEDRQGRSADRLVRDRRGNRKAGKGVQPSAGRLVRSWRRADQAASGNRLRRRLQPPGVVLDDRLTVACGDGVHPAAQVQRAGRAPMTPGRIAERLPDPQGHDPAVTRWRLTIEYDGGPFMGWQRQDHGPSVQQTLEEALRADDRRTRGILRGRTHRRRSACAGDERARRCRPGADAAPAARGAQRACSAAPHLGPAGRAGRGRLARPLLVHRAALSLPHPQPPSAAGARRRASVAYRRARSTWKQCARARRIWSDVTTSRPSARRNASPTAR